MTKPLPRIGVDILYYAPLTKDDSTGVTYGAPQRMYGVSSIGYKPNSQHVPYYADDGLFAAAVADGKVEVEIKVADLTSDQYAFLMGTTIDSIGRITEGNTDVPPEVAIGYRSMKANGKYRYEWLLKGIFIKPEQTSTTKNDGIEMQEATIMFYPMNRIFDGNTRFRYDSDNASAPVGLTDAALASPDTGWFANPDYVPAAPGTAISDLAAALGSASGEINLTFTEPTGAVSVTPQVEVFGGEWVDADVKTSASGAITIENLVAGNTYNCRLLVVGGANNGISNTSSAAAGA